MQRHIRITSKERQKKQRSQAQSTKAPEIIRFKPRQKPMKHWLRNMKVVNLKDENRHCTRCKKMTMHSFTMEGMKVKQICKECGKKK